MKYTAHGKQVQRGSEHVADAADETWAQIITDALNGGRYGYKGRLYPYQREALRAMRVDPIRVSSYDYTSEPDKTVQPGDKFTFDAAGHRYEGVIPYHSEHKVTRHIDGYRCSCGRKWDSDEGDECPGATTR